MSYTGQTATPNMSSGEEEYSNRKEQEKPETPPPSSDLQAMEEGAPTAAGGAPGRPVVPEGGRQAWLAAAGSGAIMFCTFGYLNAFGVFQDYYFTHQLQGYSQSAISWIGSVQVFWQFAGGAVSGPLFDRYGTVILFPPAIGYVLSIVFTSLSSTYYQFFLSQSILGGICIGLLFSPALAIISHYFDRRRGAAMGLVVAGSSLGGVVFPIVLNRLLYVHDVGFGWSVRACALIVLVLLAFSLSVMRARGHHFQSGKKEKFDFALLRTPVYVLTVAGIFLMSWGLYIPYFYLPSFALKVGMSRELASYMVAILNGVSFFGRILSGLAADKLTGRYNMMCLMALGSALLLFCWPAIHTNAGIIVFSAFVGFFVGAIVSLLPACVAQITPHPRHIGTVTGISMFLWSFAGLSGPPISGAIIGPKGEFERAGIFGGAVFVAGAAILFAGRLAARPKLTDKF